MSIKLQENLKKIMRFRKMFCLTPEMRFAIINTIHLDKAKMRISTETMTGREKVAGENLLKSFEEPISEL